jgi:drug/metabolite transporter (DMT)-like permease
MVMGFGLPLNLLMRVFAATFLWGTAFPLGASALLPVLLGRGRGLIGLWRAGRPSLGGVFRILLVAFVGNALFYGFFYAGMSRTTASSAAVADGAGPVLSALLAHFFLVGDHLSRRKLAALALAFAGVVTVAFGRSSHEAGVSAVGCGLILLAMVFGSLGTMMVVRYQGRLSLMQLVGIQHLLGGAMLLVASLMIEGGAQFSNLMRFEAMAPVIYLAFVSAVAFRIWYGVVREYKVTSVAVFSFLTVIWGVGLSVTMLGERLTVPLVAGLALVVGAVWVLHGWRQSGEDHRR